MSFVKISDPKRRDEIVQEYIRMKRRIQQQSFDKILADKNIYTQGEKLFRPIIDAQKEESEKITKELQNVGEQLTLPAPPTTLPIEARLPTPPTTLPIEAPLPTVFKGVKFGKIAAKALSESFGKPNVYDNVTGLYSDDGKFFLGEKEVEFDGDDIIIDGDEYEGTPGLWELITLKNPREDSYTEDDLKNYSEIMQRSNALRSEKNPSRPKTNKGFKWINFLRPIWNEQKERETGKRPKTSSPKKKGKGVEFLPSDPALLLEQLKLSFASNQAGNSGERNRIVSILETLLGMGVITKNDYKTIAQDIK